MTFPQYAVITRQDEKPVLFLISFRLFCLALYILITHGLPCKLLSAHITLFSYSFRK